MFLHSSANGPSSTFFIEGADNSSSICFLTGLKSSSTLFGVNSSTSIPVSARNSRSTCTTDFNSFKINPPALSPSVNATTFSFSSHICLIDSSILPPSNASALSYPALKRLMISALPSTRIIHLESNMPVLQCSFFGP